MSLLAGKGGAEAAGAGAAGAGLGAAGATGGSAAAGLASGAASAASAAPAVEAAATSPGIMAGIKDYAGAKLAGGLSNATGGMAQYGDQGFTFGAPTAIEKFKAGDTSGGLRELDKMGEQGAAQQRKQQDWMQQMESMGQQNQAYRRW